MEKLGRCRQCMVLNLLLLAVGGLAWHLSGDEAFVYQVMAKLVTLFAGLLLLAHLVMALYYKLTER